jgi:tetratricopeptide (TPR) repeat protein
LADFLSDRISPALRAKELDAAVWDDPTNPGIRDLYAQSLLFAGDAAGALKQVTLSVYNSPWLDDHFYLTQTYRKLLSPAERDAVEKGLQMAVEKRFKNAVWALGGLYGALGQQDKRAQLFRSAAVREPDPKSREDLLIEAGGSYAGADDPARAEEELRAATKLDPTDYRPYSILATRVYARHKDLTAAKAVVNEGIAAGGDPLELYLGLRATEIQPDSADAFYQLGLAEEAGYQYFAAERDFSRAVELAPTNGTINAHLQDFQHKVAAGSIHDSGLASP